jgi:hypothetical protein
MDGWLGHCNKAIYGKTLKEKQRVQADSERYPVICNPYGMCFYFAILFGMDSRSWL